MKLYGYSRSSAAYRVRIALGLKGLPVESEYIHLRKGVQRGEAYAAINPQMLLPTLEEDGQLFIQSVAIIEYLDETHPNPPLLPGHPADRARVRALAAIPACDIHPIDNLRVLQYLKHELKQDDAAIEAWFNHWIRLGFEATEKLLADSEQTGTFCHGDEPGLADICLIPQVYNSQRYKMDLSVYPTIKRIWESCNQLDAFRDAMPENQPDWEP